MNSRTGRRVVITGMGVLSPLGATATTTWSALLAGASGIRRFEQPRGLGSHLAMYGGNVARHILPDVLSAKDARRMPPYIQYSICVAHDALQDAGLVGSSLDWTRCGVILGSVCGGAEIISATVSSIIQKGPRAVSPRFIMNAPINMAAGEVSVRLGLKGPQLSLSTHGTTGTHAIGRAQRLIKYGDADIMLAGATDAPLSDTILAAFAADGELSKHDSADQASRPFSQSRTGIVLSEGAAVLVLEERSHAERRGARIYAELSGYSANADATDPVNPSKDGEGMARAIRLALADAGIREHDIQYISAHGESSKAADQSEANAIASVFGSQENPPQISAPKSQLGHLMGAAGAVEAAMSVLAVRDQVVPPTLHQEDPDAACPITLNTRKHPLSIRYAMSNAHGYGLNNAVLVWQFVNQ